ncbi:MAG TPA: TonB-dependent receptor, partial [Longimicrobiaceae bacterium]|nr:TonB-dependent receptor [Longimicrobiaceae bacterium]
DGIFPSNPFTESNPLQTAALMSNDEDVWRLFGSATLRADLFTSDEHSLRFISTGGADFFRQENDLLFPAELQFEANSPLVGTSLLANGDNLNLNLNGNLVHTWARGDFTATTSAGIQYEDRDLTVARVVSQNLIAGQDGIDQATAIAVFENRQRIREVGVYVQEELNLLDERLTLTGSVRADRSSANGEDEEYFVYPKAAASYRVPWLPPHVDDLKLRVAYGETGNLPLYGQRFVTLNAGNNIGGAPGLGVFGTSTIRGSESIQPEREREIEGGFDATFFDERASLEFTYYHQNITDLLLSRSIAPGSGFTQEIFNGGELTTSGFEVALAVTPIQQDNLTWISRTTFYRTRSEISELPVPSFVPQGFGFGSAALGQFFIEEGESATQIIGPNAGVLEVLGDATPDFKMGFFNEFRFGPLSLYGLVDWQEGGNIINLTTLLYDANGVSEDYELPAGVTTPRAIPDCNPNCSGLERISGFGTYQQQYIEDASFVKLRELALSYALPQQVVGRLWNRVQDARITLSGRNLVTWSDYRGLDPEVSNFGNQQIGRNFDVAPFPPSRSFWLSFNLEF